MVMCYEFEEAGGGNEFEETRGGNELKKQGRSDCGLLEEALPACA
jgi:hypothetical protein